nr:unnamed protein product [Callosobruchus chinensis]
MGEFNYLYTYCMRNTVPSKSNDNFKLICRDRKHKFVLFARIVMSIKCHWKSPSTFLKNFTLDHKHLPYRWRCYMQRWVTSLGMTCEPVDQDCKQN